MRKGDASKQVGAAPLYWWLLSKADLHQYNCLRLALTSSESKNQRNRRIATFTEAIEAVRVFAVRGDQYDRIRCLVCGIAWLPEGLAINTHQLKLLISRCKSSINGSFQKLGFTEKLRRLAAANALISVYPFLNENTSELRKWSVRKRPANFNQVPQETQQITNTQQNVEQNQVKPPQVKQEVEQGKDIWEQIEMTDQQESIFWN
ncbi:hypothetical protein TVAG_019480 [Trichomonas vaginalis G3]|uniref:Initiator binding domain-containing protein n=1 Tax=Trichomonas vaginalis (strain ATCC PRA-98 / G3) TaxID=412133 RepID=A2DX21_TRIV3|nr:transcription-initiator DNA-binding domain ibd family [Trichomonas vaginalis G3]EAY15048.1 hypothetical protein TVAG_019480 [Trichomonas vaginalis G3]KAI5549589.1 transcription-initiator DNA-binding domain ibd family [Trichomonas vaginalis G3]|eukprot:XP_001327271.1 hypothetical protein [Trichomonas vaginalis G3]